MHFEGRFGTLQAPEFPPSCNTGGINQRTDSSPPFRLDWLRVSCALSSLSGLSDLLRFSGLHQVCGKGKHGYLHEDAWYTDVLCVGKPLLRVWHGGDAQRDRMTVEASGRNSERVASILSRSGVSFTLRRADLALDMTCLFGEGRDLILHARDTWPYRGPKPSMRTIDDMGTNEGCTFYLGGNTGLCKLRWYEKGKEQRDASAPDWMRLEFQIQPQSQQQGEWMARDVLAGKFVNVLGVTWAPHVLKGFIAGYGDRVMDKEVKVDKDIQDKLDVLTYQWRRVFDLVEELSGGDGEGFRQMFLDSMARNDKRAGERYREEAKRGLDLRDDQIPY